MGLLSTVVFVDLSGSTSFFMALGNEKATRTVTRLTQWIGDMCEAYHGRIVKKLGDGVLAVFTEAGDATSAVIAIQRGHQQRLLKWPDAIRMEIKAGIARGEVIEVDGDCYGDAVNVASRLSDLSGSNQIWATESLVNSLDDTLRLRFMSLGFVNLRGRNDALPLYKIEWQEDARKELITKPGRLVEIERPAGEDNGHIHLTYLDTQRSFSSLEMPVHIGRADQAEFCVNDPRVSRMHARIDWRKGAFFVTDLSSFGTWVRFSGSDADVPLRRDECQLHAAGEIALCVPFNDISVPTVQFSFS